MEETCVHLDGDQSLVYVAHMVLTFLRVPKPSLEPTGILTRMTWATQAACPPPWIFPLPVFRTAASEEMYFSCLIIIISKYASAGHRASSPGVSANINISTGLRQL